MKHIVVGLLGVLALTTAACGGSKSSNSTAGDQTAAKPAAQTPQATQQTALSPQPIRPATPIAFEQLMALLPDAPSGWTRSKPHGNQEGMGVAISMAEADYEKGDSSIHLDVTDTAFNPTYLAPLQFSMAAGYSERSANGYTKATPIGGSPGFEKWDSEAKLAEVTVVVGNRVVVSAKGHNVDTIDVTRALVTAVDQAKIKELK